MAVEERVEEDLDVAEQLDGTTRAEEGEGVVVEESEVVEAVGTAGTRRCASGPPVWPLPTIGPCWKRLSFLV